jgi:myo-inositol 2-dehydrogenase/D-chiro-inositol 1-dehydrogenase
MAIAVLGAGRIGRLHASLLAANPAVGSLLVVDPIQDRAEAVAMELGATAVPNPEEAIDRADAVVIAASTDAHPSLVRAAVSRGVPTFCEKPLASDLAATRELARWVEARRGVVQVGFQRRFDPAHVRARQLVRSGALGTPYLYRLIAHDHQPPPAQYIPVSGGLFRDSSIHDFDALRWISGAEVEALYAVGRVRVSPVFALHRDVDTAILTMELTDGSVAVLSQTRHNPLGYDIRMEIVGSLDALAIGLSPRTPLHPLDSDAQPMLSSPPWDSFLSRFETAYQRELNEFLQLARGEIDNPCPPSEAIEALRIAEAALLAVSEHRRVSLTEIV